MLATPISPPIASTSRLQIDSPRPVPPKRRVVDWSACEKAVKIAPTLSAGMPMPVSRTRTARRRGSPGASSDLQQDMPALGELERVVDEIAQDLRQAHGIAGDLVRHLGRDRGRKIEPLRLRALAEQRHDGVDDLGRVDGDALELELAGLDLGEVQDVVDDREKALARAGDDLGVAPLPDRQIRRRQELGHDQHAVHRRADLVAHGGEELGFRDVGGFRRLLGLAQIVGAVGDLLLERSRGASRGGDRARGSRRSCR